MHTRLVEVGGGGVRVHRLGGARAGEMRITRFLRNQAVSVEEIVASAHARTAGRVAGRHVLALQDTTDVRVASDHSGIVLHPTVAVDAADGTLLGLVQAELLGRTGAQRGRRKERAFADKQSRRWLRGACAAPHGRPISTRQGPPPSRSSPTARALSMRISRSARRAWIS